MTRFWKPACVTLLAALVGAMLIFKGGGGPAREFPDECFFNRSNDADQKKLESLLGKPMPALQVSDWINGEVTAEEMKGKVVVIDIWATWCGPCLAAIPHTNELMDKHANDGLVIVGVCSSSNGQDKLADVVAQQGIKYPVAKDPDSKTAMAYNVAFFPTYVVVDRAGKVRAIGLQPDGVDTVVKKLLAEKAPA